MRSVVVVMLAIVAGCGGEGRCAQPPCSTSGDVRCTSNADCFQTAFCDFTDGCSGEGFCAPRAQLCFQRREPVCGCDGRVYEETCHAAAAGTDLDRDGRCALPPDAFACGSRVCDRATEACLRDEETGIVECAPTDGVCTPRTCACLAPFFDCTACTEDAGAFTLTCSFRTF